MSVRVSWRTRHCRCEIEQVVAFGIVDLQRPRQRVQDAVGRADHNPAFEPNVVVGGHSGEHGDFFTAQSRHLSLSAEYLKTCLLPGVTRARRQVKNSRISRRCRHRRRRVGPDDSPRPRSGADVHRHRRDLRPVHQRRTGRQGVAGSSRPGGAGHQVGSDLPRRRWRLESRQQPGLHPDCCRRVAAPVGHRLHRPVLPTPGRPEHADRGHRRGRRRAHRRGKGTPHRVIGSLCRDHPARHRHPLDHRTAVGVLGLAIRRPRPSRPCANRASGSCVLSVGPRLPDGHRPLPRTVRRHRLPQEQAALHRGELHPGTCAPPTRSPPWPIRSG
ncbi:hypothetical protein MAUB1S_01556 [Mycolicibacterium aubagnense]